MGNRSKIIIFLPLLGISIILFLTVLASLRTYHQSELTLNEPARALEAPTPTDVPTPTLSPTPTTTATLVTPTPTKPPMKLLFGIGSQAGDAMHYRLVKESPVHMLTSWYNGTGDLEWMRIQQNDLIPRLYANKFVVHLITWSDLPEEHIETPHGPACGRPYPVSAQIVQDMKQLAQIYNGPGPMYVSLFTEFQTYTCTDNNWKGNENYYNTLKDNYRKIKDVFHQYAPRSKVALSWGGWINRYDDEGEQGGRSLFKYFDDVIRDSDFTAFQTMESDTNVGDILTMTRILGAYGKPVMLAHYKPSSGSEAVFTADMQKFFTDGVIGQLVQNGLFAFSFMDDEIINRSETSYQIAKNGILRYGK